MDALTRMSYSAAVGRALQQDLDKGGVAMRAADGQTVIQFADHYKIGQGLGWVINKGQFKDSWVEKHLQVLTAARAIGAFITRVMK